MPKRKADEGAISADDSHPTDSSRNGSRRAKMAAAKERARVAMEADKAKVQAIKQKKAAVGPSVNSSNKSKPKNVDNLKQTGPSKRPRTEPEERGSVPSLGMNMNSGYSLQRSKRLEQGENLASGRSSFATGGISSAVSASSAKSAPGPMKVEVQGPKIRPSILSRTGTSSSTSSSVKPISSDSGRMKPMMTQGMMGGPVNPNEYMMTQQNLRSYGGSSYAVGTPPYAFSPDTSTHGNSARTSNMGQKKQQRQPSLSGQKQPSSGARHAVSSSPHPFQLGPRSCGGPRATTRITADSDGDDVPPPPVSTLELQISQQVMANCVASFHNQPLPFNEPPPEAFEQSNQEVDDDEEVVDEERFFIENESLVELAPEARPSTKPQARWVLFSLIVCFLGIGLLSGHQDSVFLKVNRELVIDPAVSSCYFDSTINSAEESTIPCGNHGFVCPTKAICEFGRLVGCSSVHYEVSESREMCIFTQQTNESISTLRSLLVDWTMHDQCGGSPSESFPLFDYSKLKLVKPFELSSQHLGLDVVQQEFVVEQHDDETWVGLPKDHALEYSFGCRMGRLLKLSLSWSGSIMLIVSQSLARLAWTCMSVYPFASLAGLFLVLAAKRRRSYQAHRSMVLRDIAHVRQLAYERLQDDPSQSFVVLHIRDEIAMSLHPNSKNKRAYIIKQVWPRVVPDVVLDNRIRKTTRLVDGNPQDVWQWVAVPTRTANLP